MLPLSQRKAGHHFARSGESKCGRGQIGKPASRLARTRVAQSKEGIVFFRHRRRYAFGDAQLLALGDESFPVTRQLPAPAKMFLHKEQHHERDERTGDDEKFFTTGLQYDNVSLCFDMDSRHSSRLDPLLASVLFLSVVRLGHAAADFTLGIEHHQRSAVFIRR